MNRIDVRTFHLTRLRARMRAESFRVRLFRFCEVRAFKSLADFFFSMYDAFLFQPVSQLRRHSIALRVRRRNDQLRFPCL